MSRALRKGNMDESQRASGGYKSKMTYDIRKQKILSVVSSITEVSVNMICPFDLFGSC